jgi:hypothetical protein
MISARLAMTDTEGAAIISPLREHVIVVTGFQAREKSFIECLLQCGDPSKVS